MTKRCHHEIETKDGYPNDFICHKCQTIWTYHKGLTAVDLVAFPVVVRRIILQRQAEALASAIGVNIDNYADLED